MTCAVCGHPSNHDQSTVLLAVCDVLCIKALEALGGRILRAERARYAEWGPTHRELVHTHWPAPADALVAKALRGAWDVVPAMLAHHGCCGVTADQVTKVLDDYVHDLAITGSPHTLAELHYRFETRLNLPVYLVIREADGVPV